MISMKTRAFRLAKATLPVANTIAECVSRQVAENQRLAAQAKRRQQWFNRLASTLTWPLRQVASWIF